MPRQPKATVFKVGKAQGGQVHIGPEYTADLTRVESLLEQMLTAVRETQVSMESAIQTIEALPFASGDTALLGALQRARADNPVRCEESYLARFILEDEYAKWRRLYLPLAGRLLDTPLRLTDPDDQAISTSGQRLGDLREALTKYKKTRLVILGEPGAGKTTTMRRLALDLALDRLRDPLHGKLPFYVDLYSFTGGQPSDFLAREWEKSGLRETYGQATAHGQVCFLLDGVNQMPLANRARYIGRWAHWANAEIPSSNWAVFTCRIADYLPDLRLPEVYVLRLEPKQMLQYFELCFGPERAAALWRDFDRRLRSANDRFERLARNPLTLSLLAERATEGKPFTGSRATLFDDLAHRLLKRQLCDYGLQPERLTANPGGTLEAEMDALSRLAFAMQARAEGTSLARSAAARVRLGKSKEGQVHLSIDEVLSLARDACILEAVKGSGQDRAFAFYHHLLQEYFAARELLRRFHAGQHLASYWRVRWRWWHFAPNLLGRDRQLEPPPVKGWEETLIMAAGLAGHDANRLIESVSKGNLPLAGRCLAEARADREHLEELVRPMRGDLLVRQRSRKAHLRARIAAGLALGEIRHPDLRAQQFEFEGRIVWAMLPTMQPVPAGEFIFGSDPADPRAYRDEHTTQRRVSLPAFSIGRYPVTNAEYRLFIEADGYKDDRWWDDAGRAWKRGGPEAHADAAEDALKYWRSLREADLEQLARRYPRTPSYWRYWRGMVRLAEDEARERIREQFERPFDRPAFWDDPELSAPARPVVGVNWYEAQAYCLWLSALTGREYRLPTEAAWEKAARGVDGREYPWGDRFDAARCNTVESHIYRATPVGLYQEGVSPHGVFDMSGNVWEWTGDWYQVYQGGDVGASSDFAEKYRAVRGGSWDDSSWFARCASRGGGAPGYFSYVVGFRVLSPGSISGF